MEHPSTRPHRWGSDAPSRRSARFSPLPSRYPASTTRLWYRPDRWVTGWRRAGPEDLAERSRAPRRHGRALVPAVSEAIVALRRACPHWGPRKLRAALMGERPEVTWPAASTMDDLLRAEGLVARRHRHRRMAAPCHPFRLGAAPNDVWCIDAPSHRVSITSLTIHYTPPSRWSKPYSTSSPSFRIWQFGVSPVPASAIIGWCVAAGCGRVPRVICLDAL